jgi:hypothetical protein
VGRVRRQGPEPPSTYYYRQIYGCFFDDEYGLENIEKCRHRQRCFETDYPHSDSTWPKSREVGQKLMGNLPDDVIYKLVRGNAIELLRSRLRQVGQSGHMSESAKVCIGGEWSDGGLGSYEIINPATEQVVGLAPNCSVEQSIAACRGGS